MSSTMIEEPYFQLLFALIEKSMKAKALNIPL